MPFLIRPSRRFPVLEDRAHAHHVGYSPTRTLASSQYGTAESWIALLRRWRVGYSCYRAAIVMLAMRNIVLITLLLLAAPAVADPGFDEKYERDYNIFTPANRYAPDNPLNPAQKYAPDNPFNPTNRYDPGNPVNPTNRYNSDNPFNPANQYNPQNPLNPANRYNPNVPFKPLR